MVKVFLSHSSAQKELVEKVASKIGLNYCLFDKYTFEDGNLLSEEIVKQISICDIFALFLSNEALKSDWVREELRLLRDLKDENKIGFCAYIIDENITIDKLKSDPDFRWVTNYLLNFSQSPTIIARNLLRRIREIVWAMGDVYSSKDRLFIGRSKELSTIEQKLYGSMDNVKNTIIISGFQHVGRKRLLKEILVTKIHKQLHPSYEPFQIQLQENDSIEDFIMQLNDLLSVYDSDSLLLEMQAGVHRKEIAISLLNRLKDVKEYVLVDDNKCIVMNNGLLTDWFVDVMNHSGLENDIRLLVASTCTLKPHLERAYNNLTTLQIQPLTRSDLEVLFNAYSQLKGVKCSILERNEIIDNMTGYPEEVFWAVEDIDAVGFPLAKVRSKSQSMAYDRDLKALLDSFRQSDEILQILLILSRFEFISYELLSNIYDEDNLIEILESLSNRALFSCFGASRQYIRLNPLFSDFIRRSKLDLNSKYEKRMREIMRELIGRSNDEALDLSEQMFKIKESIRNNHNVPEIYLLPSFVLKVIVEEYHHENYPEVIELAYKVLNDFRRNNYEIIQYTIRYWLCLSLCKLQDKRFFDEIRLMNGNDYAINFLKGYYYRNACQWEKAEAFYKLAIAANPDNKVLYRSKAEHELAIVRMKLGNYPGAMELAKSSYEKFPNNPYHIECYFHCYVRSPHCESKVLDELMSAMENSYDGNKENLLAVFKAERMFFVEHQFEGAVKILRDVIERHGRTKYTISAYDALRSICSARDAMTIYNSIVSAK